MSMRLTTCFLLALGAFAVAHAADRPRIVNEGGIRDQWTLAEGVKLAAPGYPATLAERGDSVCVALGYSIKPDGSTSDFSVVRRWSSAGEQPEAYWDAFAQVGAAAVSQWKFAPRPEVRKPQPTYTVATLQFMGKQPMDGAELRGHCRVDDLAALIRQRSRITPTNSQVRRDLEQAERHRGAAAQTTIAPRPLPRPGSGNP